MLSALVIGLSAVLLSLLAARARLRNAIPGYLLDSAVTPYTVVANMDGVALVDPAGGSKHVAWDDVSEVWIRTTDRGPLEEDVFWELYAAGDVLVIPNAAHGIDKLLDEVGWRLEGFDHDAVIEAMTSTGNDSFLAWRRPR